MDRSELRQAIEVLWGGNQSRAARDLGINPATIRRALTDPSNSSYSPLNDGLASEIRNLLDQFPSGVSMTDPRQSLRILHEKMQRDGWTGAQSAASILGAAVALSKSVLGGEQTNDLLRGE